MSRKQDLTVVSVDKNTPTSVVITLEKMPDHSYVSGQYIALELEVNGEQVNRSYSFCSAPHETHWKVGVKHVPNGKASTFLNQTLKIGDKVTCLEPMGNFILPQENSSGIHFLFFAAGSGVTPVFSMIKSLLHSENAGKISLFYGNKSPEDTMFLSELEALAETNSNFNLELIYSQAGGSDALHSGRIHFGKTLELLRLHTSELTPHAFVCGPGDMITSVKNALTDNGYSENQIHTEFFTAPTSESISTTEEVAKDSEETAFSGTAQITITLDDEEHSISMNNEKGVILDAALDAGLDAPFSCRGGVCTACRAKLSKGKVEMNSNFALTDDELEEGYILTCQSHPKTDIIALSYDD